MVRQHRQPAGKVLLEIPAGKIEPGEEPLVCARRELAEETGIQALKWEELISFYPSPGFCDEIIYIFRATDLTAAVAPEGDFDENLTSLKMPLDQLAKLISEGQIQDGKTIIALQFIICQSA